MTSIKLRPWSLMSRSVLFQVIARIFYSVNRSWSGRVTISELRKSTLLQVCSTNYRSNCRIYKITRKSFQIHYGSRIIRWYASLLRRLVYAYTNKSWTDNILFVGYREVHVPVHVPIHPLRVYICTGIHM